MTGLIERHREDLLRLCREYDVRRLDLFGSAAKGNFDPQRSDLDFVVDFNNLNVENAADRFLGLLVDLEGLFGRRVDLVSYRAVRNPYFKQVIDQTRITLYAA